MLRMLLRMTIYYLKLRQIPSLCYERGFLLLPLETSAVLIFQVQLLPFCEINEKFKKFEREKRRGGKKTI
jgi:hypothetical protein